MARSNKLRTCVYYPNWNIYSTDQTPQKIPNLDKVTNIFYSFFAIDGENGIVRPSDSWCDIEKDFDREGGTNEKVSGLFAKCFELKTRQRGIQVSMSVGGWSFRDTFTSGIKSPNGIQNFVKSSTGLMMEYGFDGIDLDWEYPSSHEEIQAYLTLVKELRQELDDLEKEHSLPQGSFLLTMATPATMDKLPFWPVKEMDKYLSFWNLMTYDFAGSWSEKSSYHCNLYTVEHSESSVDATVKFFIKQGVHSRKLVIGMAAYGRSFTHTKGYGHKFSGVGRVPDPDDVEGIWNYRSLPIHGTEEQFDSKAGIAWCYDNKTKTFVSYDNLKSSFEKGKYVRKANLGGGMWWESSGITKEGEKGLVEAFVDGALGSGTLDHKDNLIRCFNRSEYLRSNGFF